MFIGQRMKHVRLILFHFLPGFSCVCIRWNTSCWDCLSGCLTLVSDPTCVGSLCFHLPSRLSARPNSLPVFSFFLLIFSFFSFFCEIALLHAFLDKPSQHFSIHLVTVNDAVQTNKHHLLGRVLLHGSAEQSLQHRFLFLRSQLLSQRWHTAYLPYVAATCCAANTNLINAL